MRYLRAVLWASMDATDPEGFRPEGLTVRCSGSSAGGGGVQFNYHYVLGDLRRVHTTLLAGPSLGVDNGPHVRFLTGALALAADSPG